VAGGRTADPGRDDDAGGNYDGDDDGHDESEDGSSGRRSSVEAKPAS
jgi:hypothetical protein